MGESIHVPRAERLIRPHRFLALTIEGLFRRSANTQIVREVQQKYNMGEWSALRAGPRGQYGSRVCAGRVCDS